MSMINVTVGGSSSPIVSEQVRTIPVVLPAGPPGPPGTINVVELTWAEFNALPVKDTQTIYIITDAATVLMARLTAIESRLAALELKGA